MDEFNNNNGQQGYDPNLYGQPSQGFNDQPNGASQFGGSQNTYGGQPQYNQYDPNMGQPSGGKGMSIAALCCGIGSLVACFINGWITLILGTLAIVFGIKGRKREGRGMATAGMICGITGIVLWGLCFLFVMIVGVAALGSLGAIY